MKRFQFEFLLITEKRGKEVKKQEKISTDAFTYEDAQKIVCECMASCQRNSLKEGKRCDIAGFRLISEKNVEHNKRRRNAHS